MFLNFAQTIVKIIGNKYRKYFVIEYYKTLIILRFLNGYMNLIYDASFPLECC
jgi:hypothetical protein